MGSKSRSPVLVGHPLTALERELKRLVVREELEKEQLKIVQDNGLSSKDVKDKLLRLYDLYETFRNVDNTCLSDTDTKYNLYKLYKEVFKTKKAYSPDSPIHNTARLWKDKPRAVTASPQRTMQKQSTRNQICTSVAHSAPVTFPQSGHGARDPPLPAAGIPTTPRRTFGANSNKASKPPGWRPHSAPADFQYNKLYTANRCYTTRRTCRPCRSHCSCLLCSPMQEPVKPCWRDITCALTPDRSQIEAHWEEMSPLIQSQLQIQQPVKKKQSKKKEQKVSPEDAKSTGRRTKKKNKRSRDDVKSVRSRGHETTKVAKVQQAWAARPSVKPTPQKQQQPVKKMRKRESGNFPQTQRKRERVQKNQYHYQRNRKTDKRYRWDKDSSDSDSEDGLDNNDILAGIENLPLDEDIVFRGRILRERKRHKWGDYQAVLTARALYLYNREYDIHPKEVLPLWGTKLSINADKTDLQYSFILKTASTHKSKAMYKMSALTEDEMREWLTKLREAMKANIDITAEIARNKKPSVFGESSDQHPSWSHEGYRIDVSYINDNILVCSFPPTRSDVYEMKRFMDDKHKSRYRIVNVCEKSYDTSMFSTNMVTCFPTPHNGICSLTDLWNFCEFTDKWLKEEDTNVVLIHCQLGTVVSGLFVSAYLIHSRVCWTSEQAIKLYKTKRENGTISAPCHRRYLKYIETSVIAGEQPEDIKLLFSNISLSNSPAFNEDGSCKPYFVVFQNGEEIYEFESTESYKTEEPISFPMSLQISGDIKIQFYSVSDILGTQDMFTIHFHTFYINSSNVRFSRDMIDGAHLNTFKQFTDTFSVSLEVK